MQPCATERDCLGYVLMIRKFSKYLRIKPFVLIGDHKPLLKLFNINHETRNKKLIRWRINLCGYTFTFEHHYGDSLHLLMEDFSSRLATPTDKVMNYEKNGVIMPRSMINSQRNYKQSVQTAQTQSISDQKSPITKIQKPNKKVINTKSITQKTPVDIAAIEHKVEEDILDLKADESVLMTEMKQIFNINLIDHDVFPAPTTQQILK